MQWPKAFITTATDSSGVGFGDKTTTLEMLVSPELFKNSHMLFRVDCFGTVFGMWNGSAKGDKIATILIRAAHLIAAYLE